MSIDVYLKDTNGVTVEVENHEEGGTYVLGGETEAHLNITYNYSKVYYLAVENFPGMIDFFNGKKAADLLPVLEAAIKKLGITRYDDYWAPTPGNAGYALSLLIPWCKQYPDAVFEAYG